MTTHTHTHTHTLVLFYIHLLESFTEFSDLFFGKLVSLSKRVSTTFILQENNVFITIISIVCYKRKKKKKEKEDY
jgi:hypothetical protein